MNYKSPDAIYRNPTCGIMSDYELPHEKWVKYIRADLVREHNSPGHCYCSKQQANLNEQVSLEDAQGKGDSLPFDPADVVSDNYEGMTREELIACCKAHDAHHAEHHEREDAFAEAYKSGRLKMRNDMTGEMQTVLPDLEYVIVSVGHTGKKDPYITFWRPDNKGYTWPLPWAGSYSHEQVIADPDYYDNGADTIAVLKSSVQDFAIPKPFPGWVEIDFGPVVQNNKENWRRLYKARIKR